MADTRRTRASLLTLYADNATQDISAQDLRDGVVSWMGGYASILTVDGSTAQTGISATPAIVTGWSANGAASDGLTPDYTTTDGITIDVDGVYAIYFQSSFSGTGSKTFEYHLRVDGVEQAEGAHRKMGTAGDVGSVSFAAIKSLSAAEVVTVYVESGDGGTSVTPLDAQLIAFQIA